MFGDYMVNVIFSINELVQYLPYEKRKIWEKEIPGNLEMYTQIEEFCKNKTKEDYRRMFDLGFSLLR